MESKLYINSIYPATEGEGIFVGTPQVFVRFQGCHIGCVNCDSKDTWSFDEAKMMSVSEVVEELQALGSIKRVSITGGDPLHPKNVPGVKELVVVLKKLGYWVNLEAAGMRVVEDLFDLFDFISFDIKTPSTSVKFNEGLLEKVLQHYGQKMQIKAVVEDRKDFDFLCDIKSRFSGSDTPWVITPAFNNHQNFPVERVENIINWNQLLDDPFRVIVQQHKVIYGSDKKNV